MAALSAPNQAEVTADLQRSDGLGGVGALKKADLVAAVSAADAWVDANSASYNTALPVAVRNALTVSQKAQLLSAVVRQRFVKGA
jgi:hypothetical protein